MHQNVWQMGVTRMTMLGLTRNKSGLFNSEKLIFSNMLGRDKNEGSKKDMIVTTLQPCLLYDKIQVLQFEGCNTIVVGLGEETAF